MVGNVDSFDSPVQRGNCVENLNAEESNDLGQKQCSEAQKDPLDLLLLGKVCRVPVPVELGDDDQHPAKRPDPFIGITKHSEAEKGIQHVKQDSNSGEDQRNRAAI